MAPIRKPRVLVVYYSRTGNTEAVAQGMARASDGELEGIQEVSSRRGLLGYLRSGFEATLERDAPILPPKHDPHDYDLVLIGSPIWSSAVSSPVRAYLKRFAGTLPDVGFFVTSGGGNDAGALAQMAQLAGKQPLAVLGLRERDLRGRFAVYLGEFWETLIGRWEARISS
jgi:multimeric flavodoxin WrbA